MPEPYAPVRAKRLFGIIPWGTEGGTPQTAPQVTPQVEDPQETAFQNWARRLIIGPRDIVRQQLSDASARERERLGLEREDIRAQSAERRARENILLNIREQARVAQEKEERGVTRERERRGAVRRAGAEARAGLPPGELAEGVPALSELLFGAGAKPEEITALRPPAEKPISLGRESRLVTPSGVELLKAEPKVGPGPEPQAWSGYDPLRQRPSLEAGVWEIKPYSPPTGELISIASDLRLRKESLTPTERQGLVRAEEQIRRRGAHERFVAGERAGGAFPYRPLTEIEQQALNWIEGGLMTITRLEAFSPEELQAMSGLLGRSRAEASLALKGALPEMFGSPTEADARFAELKSLLAEAEALAFERGGKQLTPMEKETVTGFVPQRSDLTNPVLLAGKLSNLSTALAIIKEMRLWRLNTPRGGITSSAYDAALKSALQQAGVAPTDPQRDAPRPTKGKVGGKTIRVLPPVE